MIDRPRARLHWLIEQKAHRVRVARRGLGADAQAGGQGQPHLRGIGGIGLGGLAGAEMPADRTEQPDGQGQVEMGPVHLDAADAWHRVGGPIGQQPVQRPVQQPLQCIRRDPPRRRIGVAAGPALLEVRGDVVAVELAIAAVGECG